MQLLVQVLADEGARSDAVDIDPLRLCDGVNRSLQNSKSTAAAVSVTEPAAQLVEGWAVLRAP